MNELIQPLAWDSEFFGLPIGRITTSKLSEENFPALFTSAHEEGLRCLYLEADPDDATTVSLAEKHAFHLVDVRVVLEHPFDKRPAPVPRYPIPPELVIDGFILDDLSGLCDIAAQIGLTSRFHFDKNFAPGAADRLYRLWIENACKGFAETVITARWHETGEAIGLITCTLDRGNSHIQLAGVHSNHRQHGVGTGLVQAALDWAKAQGCQRMEVISPRPVTYLLRGFTSKWVSLPGR